jgi:PIN domain nuclease of toxin-antitoxin system
MADAEVKYLLDTAPWINGVTMPEALPVRVRRLLDGTTPKGLCSVSLLETAILFRLGRLEMDGTLRDFFDAAIAADLRILELTPAIALRTSELAASFPGDPFDRTIVATAAVLNLTLVTADPAIRTARACDVEYHPFIPMRRQGR